MLEKKQEEREDNLKNILLTEVFRANRKFRVNDILGAPLLESLHSKKSIETVPYGKEFESNSVLYSEDNNFAAVRYIINSNAQDSKETTNSNSTSSSSSKNMATIEGWIPLDLLEEITVKDQEYKEMELLLERELNDLKDRALTIKLSHENKGIILIITYNYYFFLKHKNNYFFLKKKKCFPLKITFSKT